MYEITKVRGMGKDQLVRYAAEHDIPLPEGKVNLKAIRDIITSTVERRESRRGTFADAYFRKVAKSLSDALGVLAGEKITITRSKAIPDGLKVTVERTGSLSTYVEHFGIEGDDGLPAGDVPAGIPNIEETPEIQ